VAFSTQKYALTLRISQLSMYVVGTANRMTTNRLGKRLFRLLAAFMTAHGVGILGDYSGA
jgi:hypothetical protein